MCCGLASKIGRQQTTFKSFSNEQYFTYTILPAAKQDLASSTASAILCMSFSYLNQICIPFHLKKVDHIPGFCFCYRFVSVACYQTPWTAKLQKGTDGTLGKGILLNFADTVTDTEWTKYTVHKSLPSGNTLPLAPEST